MGAPATTVEGVARNAFIAFLNARLVEKLVFLFSPSTREGPYRWLILQ